MIASPSPRLLKGALVALELLGRPPRLIPFQYNPAEVSRSLEPQYRDGGNGYGWQWFTGPPAETISLEVQIDAADDRARGMDAGAGIHPHLAALEMLMFPPTAAVVGNLALAKAGMLEVTPPEAPLTLFVWGPARVQPVRLASYSVTETLHDPLLNPIAARVSLSLRALGYRDFPPQHRGLALALASQATRETLAMAAQAKDLAGITGLGHLP